MAPAVTREWEIDYGGVKIGGTSDRLIYGKWRWSESDERAVVEVPFLIAKDTVATYIAERQAVEVAFRIPRQALTITLSGSTMRLYSHTAASGFNGRASLSDDGAGEDTARSRRYTFRFECELPANTASRNGLRESEIEIDFSNANRKRFTFRGLYTAVSSAGALAQHDAQADTYCRGKITAFGYTEASFELVSPTRPAVDDTDRNCSFIRTYEQVLFRESIDYLNDPAITSPSLRIDRVKVAAQDSPGVVATGDKTGQAVSPEAAKIGTSVKPPELLTLTYEAFINSDLSTDLEGKWRDVILPWLERTIGTYTAGSKLVWREIKPAFDPVQNRISASVRVDACASPLLSLVVETDEDWDYGHPIASVWSTQPTAGVSSQGPARLMRTVTRISKMLGAFNFFIPLSIPEPEPSGWVHQSKRRRVVRRQEGVAGREVDTTSLIEVERRRYVQPPTGGPATDSRVATGRA